MSELLEGVTRAIQQHKLIVPGTVTVVAASGGVDSVVLLHALWRLRERLDAHVHVATLDHGLREGAGAEDAAFVQRMAADLGLPVTAGRADVRGVAGDLRLGIEDAARRVRYAFLAAVARAVGAAQVAVGHTRDDQAETVLLHLIRGSGLDGLRGMLPRATLPGGYGGLAASIAFEPPLAPAPAGGDMIWLVRPLLGVSRQAIERYARAEGLSYREDATNADPLYVRNRLRHEVLPLLETLNPNVHEAVARLADVLREDAALLTSVYDAALARLIRDRLVGRIELDRPGWLSLSLAEQRGVLRAAIRQLAPDLKDLGYVAIERAVRFAAQDRADGGIDLRGGIVLRRAGEALTIAREGAAWDDFDAPGWVGDLEERRFAAGDPFACQIGRWVFEARFLAPGTDPAPYHEDPLAAALTVPPGASLALRTRRPGDRFRPRGLGGHAQKLSDTLINMRVPQPWRDRVPLLTVDGEIAWFVAPSRQDVRGRVAEPFAVERQKGGTLVAVQWRKGGEK